MRADLVMGIDPCAWCAWTILEYSVNVKGTMQQSKPFKFCYDFTGCKIEYFRILVRVWYTKWHREARILLEGQGSIKADRKA